MTSIRATDINDIRGVDFYCQCGGSATMEVYDSGIACDVNSPDVEIRVRMKSMDPEKGKWTFRQVEST